MNIVVFVVTTLCTTVNCVVGTTVLFEHTFWMLWAD